MELWDVYDAHRVKKNYEVSKTISLKPGDYHLVVHVCVFNKNNEMLIQKRRKDKANWPGKWDFSSGGAAIAGESSNTAAERELFEELSIRVPLSDERPLITVHFDDGFDDYYAIEIDSQLESQIQFAKREIDSIKWASYEEIVRLIDTGELDILKSFIGVIFDMRKKRGNHI